MIFLQRRMPHINPNAGHGDNEWSWWAFFIGLILFCGITLIFYLLAMRTYKKVKKRDEKKLALMKKYMKMKKGKKRRK